MNLKELPEDFIVEEKPLNLFLQKKGDYCYFLLTKKNKNTLDVIKEISKKLRIRERNFHVAGIKDKKAVTTQYVSGYRIDVRALKRLRIPDVTLEFLGYGDERLKLGQLEGNVFTVVVRNLECKEHKHVSFLENYFDEQRFSGKNVLLGNILIKKEFRKFCYSLHLKWKQGDYVNAIRTIPKRRLIFYINAYQSYLWNEVVAAYLQKNLPSFSSAAYSEGTFVFSDAQLPQASVPILGYATDLTGSAFKELYEELMRLEHLTTKDFILKELPELISEGTSRNLYVNVNLSVQYEKDDRHPGKYKALVKFSLPPGSYATLVIKKMFS